VLIADADLARAEAPAEIVMTLTCPGIAIEALVNNAGFGSPGESVKTDLTAELEMIQVNVTALTHLTKLILPPMVERKRGAILNVASTASFLDGRVLATKAYVLSFSEAIADELRDSGVTAKLADPRDEGGAVIARETQNGKRRGAAQEIRMASATSLREQSTNASPTKPTNSSSTPPARKRSDHSNSDLGEMDDAHKGPIIEELEAKFEFLMEKLGVCGTKEAVARYLKATPSDLPEYAAVSAELKAAAVVDANEGE
jgi:NAD(P)-dependent dehydrogenase (short-subunit alcohol dehydrogenase family)